jgi:NADPH2:quinone reductase
MPIDKVFPFAEIGAAFAHMAVNKQLGKIVVKL